jgi:hypothetical protein
MTCTEADPRPAARLGMRAVELLTLTGATHHYLPAGDARYIILAINVSGCCKVLLYSSELCR